MALTKKDRSLYWSVVKELEKWKKEFTGVYYSPKTGEVILLRDKMQFALVRNGKEDQLYFEYGDQEVYGKFITNKKLERLKFERVGRL